jgi:hypothetical protein
MNLQQRADERSKALHREVAKKLRKNPDLWAVPKDNISRWKKERESCASVIYEWERILIHQSNEQILAILEGDSEEAARLRSSSPFTGILTDGERKQIFDLYRSRNARGKDESS